MRRADVFNRIRALEAVQVKVEFNGGGDEGEIGRIILLDAHGQEIGELVETPASRYWSEDFKSCPITQAERDHDELINALQHPVWARYGGFTGEPFVEGAVVWDACDETVSIKAQQYFDDEDADFETL
jgi:hypothetical protein